MFDYDLEHILSYTVTLDAPEVVGPVPGGVRANFYTTGGEVNGPKLQGKVRPVGGDWLTLRTDGVTVLDIRNTLEVGEGALVDVSLSGVGDLVCIQDRCRVSHYNGTHEKSNLRSFAC